MQRTVLVYYFFLFYTEKMDSITHASNAEVISVIKSFLISHFTFSTVVSYALFFLLIVFLLVFFKTINKLASKFTAKKCSVQTQHLIKKVIHYIGIIVIISTVFKRLGINLTALLGAAGIAGIAIGFAAQTSVANVISGLFVMGEKAFEIGNIIQINDIMGTVEAIDLLSVTLKTFDHQAVRIPNETVIKANLINYSRYPYWRVKMDISVAYGTDLTKTEEVLLCAAKTIEFTLTDPPPFVRWNGFKDSAITCTLHAWALNENFGKLQNALYLAVNERFKQAGITIPFPQLDIHIDREGQSTSDENMTV